MQLNEIHYDDAVPVDGYGAGFFRVGGQVFQGPILVMPNDVVPWAGFEDVAAIQPFTDQIDVLFVGTGAEIAHIPTSLKTPIEETGIGVEPMSSPSACRTYNVLVSEGRRIGLALIPV